MVILRNCFQYNKIEKLTKTDYTFAGPDFVSSIEDEEHVYFFFRESAVEHINCGKVSVANQLQSNQTIEKSLKSH